MNRKMIDLKQKLFNLPGIHDTHYAKDLIFQMLADVPSRITSADVVEKLNSFTNQVSSLQNYMNKQKYVYVKLSTIY